MFESDPADAGDSAEPEDQINPVEANHWWRQSTPAGALVNKLMVLFIVAPIALVLKGFYTLSFFIFVLILPYGFFVRHLAVRAVRRHLDEHPDDHEAFQQAGIVF